MWIGVVWCGSAWSILGVAWSSVNRRGLVGEWHGLVDRRGLVAWSIVDWRGLVGCVSWSRVDRVV